jgi:hypothetical protein
MIASSMEGSKFEERFYSALYAGRIFPPVPADIPIALQSVVSKRRCVKKGYGKGSNIS